jgi:tetratricopeptide (TPR) repeat protein
LAAAGSFCAFLFFDVVLSPSRTLGDSFIVALCSAVTSLYHTPGRWSAEQLWTTASLLPLPRSSFSPGSRCNSPSLSFAKKSQVTPEQKKAAAGHKELGNKMFVSGKFDEAAKHFTDALNEDPTDHVFYSNRSACYASVGKLSAAVEDANKCVELKPEWGKGGERGTIPSVKKWIPPPLRAPYSSPRCFFPTQMSPAFPVSCFSSRTRCLRQLLVLHLSCYE